MAKSVPFPPVILSVVISLLKMISWGWIDYLKICTDYYILQRMLILSKHSDNKFALLAIMWARTSRPIHHQGRGQIITLLEEHKYFIGSWGFGDKITGHTVWFEAILSLFVWPLSLGVEECQHWVTYASSLFSNEWRHYHCGCFSKPVCSVASNLMPLLSVCMAF